jgi:2-octaprenyl-6-methoxyphenol hydroxylase
MSMEPVAILGGGPVGLTLGLLLARLHVPAVVFDARSVDEARRDRRLLALSRGTLDTLGAVITLPVGALAPIRTVVVSSRGEFGRAVLNAAELGDRPLGATVRYGDLLGSLDAACARQPLLQVRRPCAVESLHQAPDAVTVRLSNGESLVAPVAVNAEGAVGRPTASREGSGAARPWRVEQTALIADVDVAGPSAGAAYERFTRDGPLALLPLPGSARGASRPMALVWCMPVAVADRREKLGDDAFMADLQDALGERNGRVLAVRERGRYPLVEQARDDVREHRVVFVGNSAQTLHPVAGQGLNLGVRDCVALADVIAAAAAAGEDPGPRLADYERLRRVDRFAIRAFTRTVPGLFATRFAPVAAARSVGLTLLSILPDLRAEFARVLMFGVRS